MDDPSSGLHKVRYLVFTWVPEDLLPSWNQWHNEVHVPAVLETSQMRTARKYRVTDTTLPGDWQPQYVTIYELDSMADMAAYLAGPAVALREDYQARYGHVGKIARLILHEEVRFDVIE
jgi:hypothetical protein